MFCPGSPSTCRTACANLAHESASLTPGAQHPAADVAPACSSTMPTPAFCGVALLARARVPTSIALALGLGRFAAPANQPRRPWTGCRDFLHRLVASTLAQQCSRHIDETTRPHQIPPARLVHARPLPPPHRYGPQLQSGGKQRGGHREGHPAEQQSTENRRVQGTLEANSQTEIPTRQGKEGQALHGKSPAMPSSIARGAGRSGAPHVSS